MMTQETPDTVPARPVARRPAKPQPLAILDIDGSFLTLETVMHLTGLRKTNIYAMMAAGTFPESVKVSARSVRWRAEEIRLWIQRKSREAYFPPPT